MNHEASVNNFSCCHCFVLLLTLDLALPSLTGILLFLMLL